jgi:hypothetical protein
VKDIAGAECSFSIELMDISPPPASCPCRGQNVRHPKWRDILEVPATSGIRCAGRLSPLALQNDLWRFGALHSADGQGGVTLLLLAHMKAGGDQVESGALNACSSVVDSFASLPAGAACG